MDIIEYNKVKEFCYLEYCEYLVHKYGACKYDYCTKSGNKNAKVTRTKEGLLIHHKMEYLVNCICKKEQILKYPMEWQYAKNLVPCNYLEHLLLHILIVEEYFDIYKKEENIYVNWVGIGGVAEIVSDINSCYIMTDIQQAWQRNCYNAIKENIENIYIDLLKRIIGIDMWSCKVLQIARVEGYKTLTDEEQINKEKLNNKIFQLFENRETKVYLGDNFILGRKHIEYFEVDTYKKYSILRKIV